MVNLKDIYNEIHVVGTYTDNNINYSFDLIVTNNFTNQITADNNGNTIDLPYNSTTINGNYSFVYFNYENANETNKITNFFVLNFNYFCIEFINDIIF